MSKKLLIFIGLLVMGVLAVGLMVTRNGETAVAKLNQAGNDQFYADAYDEAWGMYQSAQMENPELAESYYNAANALYKQGLYEEALTQMGMALQFASDESLAEQVFFNLGNSSFNMQDMETAVSSYIEALLRNPDDADAKYNLELALVQQQEQEQEEQEQEQEEQEEQDQEEQEEEESDEGEEQNEDQSDEGEEEQENDQSGEGEDEKDESQEGEEGEEEQEGDESESEEPSDPQEGEGEEESEPQDGEGQPSEPTDEEGSDGFTPAPGERMTQEQAEQLLAALAGDSQTLQEALGQVLMVPNGRPPSQDW